MHKVFPFFPLSANGARGNAKSLIVTLIIYLVACAILRVLTMILGWIPLVGWLLELIFSLLGIYCVAGIVLAIYRFVQE